jgi:hypothetical protein
MDKREAMDKVKAYKALDNYWQYFNCTPKIAIYTRGIRAKRIRKFG